MLGEVLESCIDEIRDRHRLPDDAVALDGACEAIVRGDRTELAVVFRNLLENAVKYSDEPVEVKVSVSGPRDGRVFVDISDRGIGIPVGELRKIFQRFYRAGRDVQRAAAGLGLGLFIVRNLVRRPGWPCRGAQRRRWRGKSICRDTEGREPGPHRAVVIRECSAGRRKRNWSGHATLRSRCTGF